MAAEEELWTELLKEASYQDPLIREKAAALVESGRIQEVSGKIDVPLLDSSGKPVQSSPDAGTQVPSMEVAPIDEGVELTEEDLAIITLAENPERVASLIEVISNISGDELSWDETAALIEAADIQLIEISFGDESEAEITHVAGNGYVTVES